MSAWQNAKMLLDADGLLFMRSIPHSQCAFCSKIVRPWMKLVKLASVEKEDVIWVNRQQQQHHPHLQQPALYPQLVNNQG